MATKNHKMVRLCHIKQEKQNKSQKQYSVDTRPFFFFSPQISNNHADCPDSNPDNYPRKSIVPP